MDHPSPLALLAGDRNKTPKSNTATCCIVTGRAPDTTSAQQFKNPMTSAFQDAILGHIAVADPAPADALEVFFNVCLYEDATLPQYVDALKQLKDVGLIVLAGYDSTELLIRLTEDGRRYVYELISDALLAMRAIGRIAEA